MENFVFNVIRANILISIFCMFTFLIGCMVKRKYSYRWKYMMWLVMGIFLLFPFPIGSSRAPIQIVIPEPRTVEEKLTENGKVSLIQSDSVTVLSNSEVTEELLFEKDTLSDEKLSVSLVFFLILEIWIFGIVLFALYRMFSYALFNKDLYRWAVSLEEQEILAHYRKCCQNLKITHPPVLMISVKLQSPLLVGLKTVRLYLPKESYSREELDLIFYHELIHYKRKDLWYKTFLLIVNTIYWFNPFLYLARYEAQKDLEYLCDSMVVQHRSKEECTIYSRLLLKTAAQTGYSGNASASLNDGSATLKERIVIIMKNKKMKYGIFPAFLCLAILLTIQFLVGCSVQNSPETNQTDNSENTGSSDETSYTDPEELITDFLYAYFSVTLEDADKALKELEEKHEISMPMQNSFTEEGLQNAVANRTTIRAYDLAITKNSDIEISDIELKKTEDSPPQRYDYEVTLVYSEDTEPETLKGYFYVKEIDQEWKIHSFQITNYKNK